MTTAREALQMLLRCSCPESSDEWKAYYAADRVARAVLAQPESTLTDAEIIAIRDSLLPAQGEPFDCIAFARAVLERQREDVYLANGVADLAIKHRDLAEAENVRLRAALERAYQPHHVTCRARYPREACTCGLDAAMSAEQEPKP